MTTSSPGAAPAAPAGDPPASAWTRPVPAWLGAVLDAGFVLLFVVLGRDTHEEVPSVRGTLEVAAPFLLALAAGWLVLQAWRRPASLLTGAGVWAVTVALGMVLRATVFDRGTATSFVVVTAAFLLLFLVGWRLVALLLRNALRRP